MKYKVTEHLTHVTSVIVNAENEKQAWEEAMEKGLMCEFGNLDDMYVTKYEVEEINKCQK